MFTGLIEELGRIEAIEPVGGGKRLAIAAVLVPAGLTPGDSVAVNGVCLTVVACNSAGFTAEAVTETLERSTLASLRAGESVNLERALAASGRFGGHFVQGHVDGVGEVIALQPRAPGYWLQVKVPDALLPLMVEKGSIAIDGVSLTIAALEGETVSVALIPHSARQTTLGQKRRGDQVNIESDIIGKYVQRLLEGRPGKKPLTGEMLHEWGY